MLWQYLSAILLLLFAAVSRQQQHQQWQPRLQQPTSFLPSWLSSTFQTDQTVQPTELSYVDTTVQQRIWDALKRLEGGNKERREEEENEEDKDRDGDGEKVKKGKNGDKDNSNEKDDGSIDYRSSDKGSKFDADEEEKGEIEVENYRKERSMKSDQEFEKEKDELARRQEETESVDYMYEDANQFDRVEHKTHRDDFKVKKLEQEEELAMKDRRWHLYKVDNDLYPNAVCIDGSPGGYWFSKGYGDGVDKFLIHHQGGGWCRSLHECNARARGKHNFLGSSLSWVKDAYCDSESYWKKNTDHKRDKSHPCISDGGSRGLLSFSSNINPRMYNWNKIFIGYCDGSSFSGRAEEAVHYKTKEKTYDLYFKGHYILDAVYDMFLKDHQMDVSEEIVISGSSAGGLAVFLNLDYLVKKIRYAIDGNKPSIVGIADGGYFMDYPSIENEMKLQPYYQDMYEVQNVSVDQGCINAYRWDIKDGLWKCLMPQYLLKYVQSPVFIVQSFIDTYQQTTVMDINCRAGSRSTGNRCSKKELAYIKDFKSKMFNSIDKLLPKNSGYWLVSCGYHTITNHDYAWNVTTADTRTLRETLFAWYDAVVLKLKKGKDFPAKIGKEVQNEEYEFEKSMAC